jgi:hypothetical protein
MCLLHSEPSAAVVDAAHISRLRLLEVLQLAELCPEIVAAIRFGVRCVARQDVGRASLQLLRV